ncbi:putative protein LONGIFOLIA [Helianthus annuus]|nr:putative protein LONGIFOLIA [Helianthus annuus]
MAELVHRHNDKKQMEKQIGCMSSFLHIFDRQQIQARKRIHSAKRLTPSVGESPDTLSSGDSQEFCKELEKLEPEKDRTMYPGKCINELDSMPTVSVVARLMGLESLSTTLEKPIRRTGSESRVSRDLVHSKYIDIDCNNFQVKQPNQAHNLKPECSRTSHRSLETRVALTMDDELEKRLKMRGMDEQFNDLNALKQILEVLQLKGLLHSTNRSNRDSQQNFVYDPNESSIHLKKWRSLAAKVDQHRSVNDRSVRIPARVATTSTNRIESNLKSCNSIVKRRPLSIEIERRSIASSNISTSPLDSPKLTPKKPGSGYHSITNRSPRHHKLTESYSVNSPKQNFIKKDVRDNESSPISKSIAKSASATNLEVSEWNGYKDGKLLLERCDRLLHSIAEMNNASSATESPLSSAAVLPSPVSVLDPGFDKDESSSPSYSIDFKASPAIDFDDDNWTTQISPTEQEEHDEHEELISDDSDFIYISKILRAPQHLRDDPNVFLSIEKQFYESKNISHVFNISKGHRKLVFDVISEMLDRNRQMPPWKVSIRDSRASVKQIWNEFQKIRELIINTGDDIDLLELVTRVLKKEVEVKDWDDYPIETSEVILDVERLIFKDLVGDLIGDLVEFSGECVFSRTRRKLVF